MVKGVSRRVIVVKPEEQGLFEQAIFLVRDYGAPRGDMVREACRIADGYLASKYPQHRAAAGRRALLAGFCAGALLVGTLWVLSAVAL